MADPMSILAGIQAGKTILDLFGGGGKKKPESKLGKIFNAAGWEGAADLVNSDWAPLLQLGGQFGLQALLGGNESDELKRMVEERVAAQDAIIPDIRRQAAGEPSKASAAIEEQVRQQFETQRQAAAISASRAGQGGTASERAQTFGDEQAIVNAMVQAVGQLQATAQQQLLGLPVTELQMAVMADQTMKRQNIGTYLQTLMAVPDEELTELQKDNKRLLQLLQVLITKGANYQRTTPLQTGTGTTTSTTDTRIPGINAPVTGADYGL